MAAPKFAPVDATESPRVYRSPDHVPQPWTASRPGDIVGFQPRGLGLGYQGPDQGFALRLANALRDRLILQPGENADDVLAGAVKIGLRRASLMSRAPVVHDLTVALSMWGFLDPNAPADQVAERKVRFHGVASGHHHAHGRSLADMVPEATLRMSPAQVEAAAGRWRDLVGVLSRESGSGSSSGE